MKTISRFFQFILSLSLILQSSITFAATEVKGIKGLRKKLGVENLKPEGYDLANIKIAVIDVGFKGYVAGKNMLPETAELVHYDPDKPFTSTKDHGLRMAQIIWSVTGKTDNGPKLYLLNGDGLTNIKKAIDFSIEKKVDIIVFSATWYFGTNFDGSGPLNAQVNRATERGIIWINAAGNDSKMMFNAKIDNENIRRDRFLKLKGDKDDIRFENKYDNSDVDIYLSWSDFKDDDNYAAVKDLDLFVYDSKGKQIASGEKIQRGEAPPKDDKNSQLSIIARETVTLENLDRGQYVIKVKAKTDDNFLPNDRLRIVIVPTEKTSGNPIVFTDRTAGSEILPPADNASVFTVGENTQKSAEGITTDKRLKPDILVENAVVEFTDGKNMAGSSNAAAIIAGEVALLKALCKGLDFERLVNYSVKLRKKIKEDEDLVYINPKDVPKKVLGIVPTGGEVKMSTDGHLVILTPVDPLTMSLFEDLKNPPKREKQTDIIVISKDLKNWSIYSLEDIKNGSKIKEDEVEFRRLRSPVGVWQAPKASNACLQK